MQSRFAERARRLTLGVDAHAVRPGCTPEGVLAELARIGEFGRSLTEQEWAERYARHDQVVVDIKAPEDKP